MLTNCSQRCNGGIADTFVSWFAAAVPFGTGMIMLLTDIGVLQMDLTKFTLTVFTFTVVMAYDAKDPKMNVGHPLSNGLNFEND